MNLYVIRHGQTIVNKYNLINSINMIGLTKKGIKEALNASLNIKNIDIDLILCSPLRRTKQTCKIINKNKVKVIFDKRLLERNSRSMQFKKIAILDNNIWYDINKDIVYKNSEGFKSILKRTEEFLNELQEKYKDKNILIVTHGDVCKAIYAIVNNIKDIKTISEFEQQTSEIKEYIIN